MSIVALFAIGPVIGVAYGLSRIARGRRARLARRAALERRALTRIRYVCFSTGCYGEMLPTGRSCLTDGVLHYEHACDECATTVVLKKEYPFEVRMPL
jgi:hypothetical protein